MDVTFSTVAVAAGVLVAVTVLVVVVSKFRARRANARRDAAAVRWVMRINDVHLDDVVFSDGMLQVRLHGDGVWRWDRRGRHQFYDTKARVNIWRHSRENLLVDTNVLMPETFQLSLPGGQGGLAAMLDVGERCQVVHLRLSGSGPVPGENIKRFSISDGSNVLLRFQDGRLGRPRQVPSTLQAQPTPVPVPQPTQAGAVSPAPVKTSPAVPVVDTSQPDAATGTTGSQDPMDLGSRPAQPNR